MNRIQLCLQNLINKKEKAIIPFLMGGLPDEDLSIAIVNAVIKGGADIIEIGVPYTDPIADGNLIENYHHQGIEKGLNLPSTLDFIQQVRETSDIPIALFSYFNPIYKMGLTAFAARCKEIGIDSVIIPDLPFEELITFRKTGLDLIPIVAPSSSARRLNFLSDIEASFIYAASVSGTTGIRELAIPELKDYLTEIRQYSALPLALGFGLSKAEQITELGPYADAFVIGSHLVNIIEKNKDRPDIMLSELENTIRNLKIAGSS